MTLPDPTPRGGTHERLASIADAAAYMACSTKTIRRRIADGSLTGYRSGPRMIRVDLDDIDAMLLEPINPAAKAAAS